MNSKQIFIAFLGLLLIGFGVFVALQDSGPEENGKKPPQNGDGEVVAIIEGSLGYPSEGIPDDVEVCAKEVGSEKEHCTKQHLQNEKYKYGVGYDLEVPAGDYYILASRPDSKTFHGSYTNYVTCGMEKDCNNHAPIQVSLEEGESKSGIDVLDWTQLPEKLSYETKMEEIELESPAPFDVLSGSTTIAGRARGTWFFEADFPIRLMSPDGVEATTTIAQAQGEWMTEDFVDFEAELKLKKQGSGLNFLVLEKDNPSGREENAGELRIPVYIE